MDDEARAGSLARVAEAFRTGRSAPLVIADRVTDEPIGLLDVQFRDDQVATIAYSVFPGHRGKGVAPRAALLAVDWAFGELGLSEVLLEIDPGNLASVRVARKCGFEPAERAGTGGKLVFAAPKGCEPGRASGRPAR
jgi:RimJ/RimL family protein N-acetyltransferase